MSLEGQKIDYIFLGSSRVDNTINAEIIEHKTGKKTLNLGIQAAKADDYYLMLKLIDDLNIQNEKIFIQMDYAFDLGGNSEILNSYLMPYTTNSVIREHLKKSLNDSWWIMNFPFYKYLKYDYKIGFREVFSTSIGKRTKTNFENGFFPKYGYSGVALKGKLSETISAQNIHVNAINEFAREATMNVIYFTAPFCPQTKNLDYTSKLASKLPVFWDFSTLIKSDKYFYDCNHINNKGATIFSNKIADKINSFETK